MVGYSAVAHLEGPAAAVGVADVGVLVEHHQRRCGGVLPQRVLQQLWQRALRIAHPRVSALTD